MAAYLIKEKKRYPDGDPRNEDRKTFLSDTQAEQTYKVMQALIKHQRRRGKEEMDGKKQAQEHCFDQGSQ